MAGDVLMRAYGKSVSAQNKITVITGLPGTGKSHLLKNIIIPDLVSKKKKVIVVDVNKEFTGGNGVLIYRLKSYFDADRELEELIGFLLKNKGFTDYLIIDECNVVLNKYQLLPDMKKLVNTLRHEKIDLICIARRPVSINVDISELARERYIFKTTGKNDIDRLNDIIKGLGDRAAALSGHHYLHVVNDTEIIEC